MPAAPLIIAGVGLAVATVGTVASISAQNKAATASKQEYAFQQQIQQNNDIRSRRDAIRAARISAGSLMQAGANQGVSDSSAAQGGIGSIQSQLDTGLSFLDTQSGLRDKAGAAGLAAMNARVNASNWGQISSLGMAIFNSSDSISNKFFPKGAGH